MHETSLADIGGLAYQLVLLLFLTLWSKPLKAILPAKDRTHAFHTFWEPVNFIFGVGRASKLRKMHSEHSCTVRISVGMKAWLKLAVSVLGFEPTSGRRMGWGPIKQGRLRQASQRALEE